MRVFIAVAARCLRGPRTPEITIKIVPAIAPRPVLKLDTSLLSPGLRLGVGLSGGADSVALIRALASLAPGLGIVLHAAHLHHGLRGPEADRDRDFAAQLAASLRLPFHTHQVDTSAEAAHDRKTEKPRESLEEAARRLRYTWFRELMARGEVDAVATAHTLDDQAETVLGKLLRGAWTEGLSGIHPVVHFPEGRILRPLLAATRTEVEAYLTALGQPWCEDLSNRDPAFTRNRLRHQLLPSLESMLESENPRIREHLAHMATLARDEEAWWQSELTRIAPQLLLTGRPVRGGGRASAGADNYAPIAPIAFDVVRLGQQPIAMQRRLLRHAAQTLGVSLTFEATETLRQLATQGRSGQKASLPGPLTAERTPRELRLAPTTSKASRNPASDAQSVEHQLPIPGELIAFGWRFEALAESASLPATIRNWKAGDRVTLRHSSGPRKIKEVLDRLQVSGADRVLWPVVEWQGQILWMQGADLQPVPGLTISATRLLEQHPDQPPPTCPESEE